MAVRAEDLPEPRVRREAVRIVWQGKRIQRFVFPWGRILEFPDGQEPRLLQKPMQ